ncbi:hypothetical protein FHS83_001421 [Rhizomicrobium palustre]|uniref:Uncharacterized protein n=1 Tax=Rhizomicrobium palustre TaxID=189966 RepID=A0A846MXT1_9PROT|nr:hypothetical protein [Rhizomicrobium palustre]NIK88103.1 hypothetical protein [Rhizomicrobium palustre]
MDANFWAAVAAIASGFTAAITLFIAWANHRVTLAAEKSYDFNSCLTVVFQVGQALRQVRDAPDDKKEFEFRELLNLLEALAVGVNDKLIQAATRKMVEPFLAECYAYLKTQPSLSELLKNSVTGEGTFCELYKFASINMTQINQCIGRYNVSSDPEAPEVIRPLGTVPAADLKDENALAVR